MIVIDASAALDLLLQTAVGGRISARIALEPALHVPELLELEVLQTMRKLTHSGVVDQGRGRALLEDLFRFPLFRYRHRPLAARVWELRHNFTAYDAAYVALAESLDAILITCDAKLAAAPGHRAQIELIG